MSRVPFKERIQTGAPVLFDGGLGTEFYNKGIFINKCFDALNITKAALVKEVHEAYVDAGAEVLETNTYGANKHKLSGHGYHDKVYEINKRGAEIAREAAGDDIYVAGSIGPLGLQMEPLGPLSRDEAREMFEEQVKGLLDGGVDLFILETFVYPDELEEAVKAVRELCDLPVIAQMTVNDDATSLTGGSTEGMVRELEETGADIIGINCTVGPAVMLTWLERVRKHTKLPISIMPNAGKPRNIDGRNIYMSSPEYFGTYAKRFLQNGAQIIGGCCGTTPEHILRMRNAVSHAAVTVDMRDVAVEKFEKPPDVELIPPEGKSRLARRLHDGHFVTFVELLAPHGVSPQKEIDNARKMYYFGVDAINIPDGPRASARMSAMALAVQIQREVGIETVLHYACRDRNVIGIQSDLLGAYAMGLRNILAVTGDPPKLGNYPDATAVFDVDAIGLVNILNRLNHGLDIAGNPIGQPTGMNIGVGANPGALNLDHELRRLDWKVEAGANFIVTQPVFDLKVFEAFVKRIEHIKIPLIAGLWPLASLRNAEFMNNEVPGCHVPDWIMERMRKPETKVEARAMGVQIARETLEEMKPMIAGVQVSAPFGRVQTVIDLLSTVEYPRAKMFERLGE
ncbi:MAG: bifunctional homocysteine S-methyltransferase/methylenetetrahydrofolate reductase [Ectothiorhodospiraceae bacterium]|nr:bifunctional homocysteine S-methyltransferase/methylenetetrahydrofolate reductase [Ectothiorhodospiraceae bacterium]